MATKKSRKLSVQPAVVPSSDTPTPAEIAAEIPVAVANPADPTMILSVVNGLAARAAESLKIRSAHRDELNEAASKVAAEIAALENMVPNLEKALEDAKEDQDRASQAEIRALLAEIPAEITRLQGEFLMQRASAVRKAEVERIQKAKDDARALTERILAAQARFSEIKVGGVKDFHQKKGERIIPLAEKLNYAASADIRGINIPDGLSEKQRGQIYGRAAYGIRMEHLATILAGNGCDPELVKPEMESFLRNEFAEYVKAYRDAKRQAEQEARMTPEQLAQKAMLDAKFEGAPESERKGKGKGKGSVEFRDEKPTRRTTTRQGFAADLTDEDMVNAVRLACEIEA